jgi:hydrogenase 3 maturation protease
MNALERWIEDRVRGRDVTIVGVGNRLRGDDAAGPRVADRLAGLEGARVIDAGTVPENFLGTLLSGGSDLVVFVDAVDHGAPPGTYCITTADSLASGTATTHAPSLRLLAGLLHGRGIECWLVGLQPGSTTPGAGLTRAVAEGVKAVARALEAACAHRVGHA